MSKLMAKLSGPLPAVAQNSLLIWLARQAIPARPSRRWGASGETVGLSSWAAWTVPVPVNYMQMMGNNLEIIGHFMYEADAHLKLLNLLRIGRLDHEARSRRMSIR